MKILENSFGTNHFLQHFIPFKRWFYHNQLLKQTERFYWIKLSKEPFSDSSLFRFFVNFGLTGR